MEGSASNGLESGVGDQAFGCRDIGADVLGEAPCLHFLRERLRSLPILFELALLLGSLPFSFLPSPPLMLLIARAVAVSPSAKAPSQFSSFCFFPSRQTWRTSR